MNYLLRSEIEPALKRDGSKAIIQLDSATMTKGSGSDPSTGQLPSCPTSSRNDRIDTIGAQDAGKAGVSVTMHHPQIKAGSHR